MIAQLALIIIAVSHPTFAAPPPSMPPDPKLGDLLKDLAGNRFTIRETDHFTIAYDTPYETLRSLTGRLEGTFDAVWIFSEHFKLPITPPTDRLAVLFLDKSEDFEEYCRNAKLRVASAAGFYDSNSNRSTFLNTMNWPDVKNLSEQIADAKRQVASQSDRGSADALQSQVSAMEAQRDALVKRFNKLIIQHEAAHQVFFNIGVHVRGADNPVWLTEGMACLFEVPQSEISRGKVQINQMRLGDFREALGVPPNVQKIDPASLRKALDDNRIVSFRDFVRDGQVAHPDSQAVSFRYSQSWAMVYYLLREHRDAFSRYLDKLAHREVGRVVSPEERIAEFEETFGPLDGPFEGKWIAFMLKLRFDPREAD